MDLAKILGGEKFHYKKLRSHKPYFVTADVVTNFGNRLLMIYPYYKLGDLREAKKSDTGKKVRGVLKCYENGTDSSYDIFYWLLVDVITGIKDVDFASKLMEEMFYFSNYTCYTTGYVNKEQFIEPGKRFLSTYFIYNKEESSTEIGQKFVATAGAYMDNASYKNEEYEIVEIKKFYNND